LCQCQRIGGTWKGVGSRPLPAERHRRNE
jgi:hypothetical protein